MTEQAPQTATIHEFSSDTVLLVCERLEESARLTRGWLRALENGTSDDALITRSSLTEVISGLVVSMRREAESLPKQRVPAVLYKILLARCAELEASQLILKQLTIDRGDPEWPELLVVWVRAAEQAISGLSAVAQDVSKRLRGPRVRRAQADENNNTLINAITLYREDPRTGEPRSARNIALWLRRNSGFDSFTDRRSDEALTRLVQRILRKL